MIPATVMLYILCQLDFGYQVINYRPMSKLKSWSVPSLLVGLFALWLLPMAARAQSPVTIVIDAKSPGAVVPPEFAGLSFETSVELPMGNGDHFFSGDNKALIDTLRTLGIKNLRVGGNSADRAATRIPDTKDIDSLFAFAHAAGVKVIYTLRLKDGDAQADADLARYIMGHYARDLSCFAVGNEPNMFDTNYAVYREHWRSFVDTITARSNAPAAKFCGPSATPGKRLWARDFSIDFAHDPRLIMITQHDYPGGAAGKVTNSAAGRDQLLSPDLLAHYEKFRDDFVPAVISNRLPFRLEEANSFFNGGAAGASDTFASALWGLDYMYWWASHGAAGINFHTGPNLNVNGGGRPGNYAVFWNTTNGCVPRCLGYGIAAFALGARGHFVPAQVTTNADAVNLTAYATRASDGLFLTVINKEHDKGARDASVTIFSRDRRKRGQVVFLSALDGNVAETSHVMLGGAAIQDGHWTGSATRLSAPTKSGAFVVTVPAASAAVIRLK